MSSLAPAISLSRTSESGAVSTAVWESQLRSGAAAFFEAPLIAAAEAREEEAERPMLLVGARKAADADVHKRSRAQHARHIRSEVRSSPPDGPCGICEQQPQSQQASQGFAARLPLGVTQR